MWTLRPKCVPGRKWANDGAAIDAAAGHNDRKLEQNVIADFHVGQKGGTVDMTALADYGLALEMSVRTDDGVLPDGHSLFDVSRIRILKRHSGQHPLLIDFIAQALFHLR